MQRMMLPAGHTNAHINVDVFSLINVITTADRDQNLPPSPETYLLKRKDRICAWLEEFLKLPPVSQLRDLAVTPTRSFVKQ